MKISSLLLRITLFCIVSTGYWETQYAMEANASIAENTHTIYMPIKHALAREALRLKAPPHITNIKLFPPEKAHLLFREILYNHILTQKDDTDFFAYKMFQELKRQIDSKEIPSKYGSVSDFINGPIGAASLHSHSETLLNVAIIESKLNFVKLLVKNGAKLNDLDEARPTRPLGLAIKHAKYALDHENTARTKPNGEAIAEEKRKRKESTEIVEYLLSCPNLDITQPAFIVEEYNITLSYIGVALYLNANNIARMVIERCGVHALKQIEDYLVFANTDSMCSHSNPLHIIASLGLSQLIKVAHLHNTSWIESYNSSGDASSQGSKLLPIHSALLTCAEEPDSLFKEYLASIEILYSYNRMSIRMPMDADTPPLVATLGAMIENNRKPTLITQIIQCLLRCGADPEATYTKQGITRTTRAFFEAFGYGQLLPPSPEQMTEKKIALCTAETQARDAIITKALNLEYLAGQEIIAHGKAERKAQYQQNLAKLSLLLCEDETLGRQHILDRQHIDEKALRELSTNAHQFWLTQLQNVPTKEERERLLLEHEQKKLTGRALCVWETLGRQHIYERTSQELSTNAHQFWLTQLQNVPTKEEYERLLLEHEQKKLTECALFEWEALREKRSSQKEESSEWETLWCAYITICTPFLVEQETNMRQKFEKSNANERAALLLQAQQEHLALITTLTVAAPQELPQAPQNSHMYLSWEALWHAYKTTCIQLLVERETNIRQKLEESNTNERAALLLQAQQEHLALITTLTTAAPQELPQEPQYTQIPLSIEDQIIQSAHATGFPVMYMAVTCNAPAETIAHLLERYSPFELSCYGSNALHQAVFLNNLSAVSTLLSSMNNYNHRAALLSYQTDSSPQYNALMIAVEQAQPEMCQLLIDYEASPHTQTGEGSSAFTYAQYLYSANPGKYDSILYTITN